MSQFIDDSESSYEVRFLVIHDVREMMQTLDMTDLLNVALFTVAALISTYILWKGANMILRTFKGQ